MDKNKVITRLRQIREERRTTMPTFTAGWPPAVVKALEAASRNIGGKGTADNVRRSVNTVIGLLKRDALSGCLAPETPRAADLEF